MFIVVPTIAAGFQKPPFEQFECTGDFLPNEEITTRMVDGNLEIEITMNFNGGLILIDPEFWRKKNSITLNLKAGAPTGAIHGCKCRKKFIFRPPQELLKDAKIIYVVISGRVEFQIDLEKIYLK